MNIPEITAAEAAALICHGDLLAVGGFGPAGSPKVITPALARRARQEHEAGRPFKVDVVTGATESSNTFIMYAEQLQNAAQKGDTNTITVDNMIFSE